MYSRIFMRINAINQNNTQTNFKAAYKVQQVVINGKTIGNKHKDELYNVTKALSDGMHKGTLSNNVKEKVNKFFKDFSDYPFVMTARSSEPMYMQTIAILSGYDAQTFHDVCQAKASADEKNWNLSHLLKINQNKRIVISAEEKNGNYVITDINYYQK